MSKKIDDLTIGEARELAKLFGGTGGGTPKDEAYPFVIGRPYFIRTVTHHLTGRLVAATKQELVLVDAAWIADDGKFSTAMKTGEFIEVEPYPDGEVIVGRGSIIDATEHKTALPRSEK